LSESQIEYLKTELKELLFFFEYAEVADNEGRKNDPNSNFFYEYESCDNDQDSNFIKFNARMMDLSKDITVEG
jgi:hypothetical protein